MGDTKSLNKLQLFVLIKVNQIALNRAIGALCEYDDLVGTKPYEDLCVKANDISQELDNLRWQYNHA